ncbi:MAG: F0F1 ATP synthase subunit A [Myxococcales bacterium]|nr:F0F1 ATP synthase subunit A [Myxococcales bacterium]MCB9672927.1 F0F1 ATP synthase subunit A [Alphaproteobacteria bacterium]
MIASGFSWLNIVPAIDHDVLGAMVGSPDFNFTVVFLSACLSSALVLLFAVVARMSLTRQLAKPEHERFQSSDKLSILTLAELLGSFIRNMMGDSMPKHEVKNYSAYIATLFLFILLCNLQGLLPGMLPPTDNINTNVGMAIASFLLFMWVGLSRDPVGFLKHLAGPSLILAPFLFSLESLSLILRPVTLSVRLTGNLFGDHQVFTIISGLAPIVVPAFLLALATFVSFVQAFVFSLLSSVYIGLSLPHDHHDHGDGHAEAAH